MSQQTIMLTAVLAIVSACGDSSDDIVSAAPVPHADHEHTPGLHELPELAEFHEVADDDGEPPEPPAADCPSDASRCRQGNAEHCEDGAWRPWDTCTYACEDGACTGVCTPELRQCDGAISQVCDASSQWTDGERCPFVCSAGECTGVCEPAAKSCDGYVPRTCDAMGQWSAGRECPFLCEEGRCTGECRPGALECRRPTRLPGIVATCDATGNWPSVGEDCDFGCLSPNGSARCNACIPNSNVCLSASTKQSCSSQGEISGTETCAYGCGDGASGQCNPAPKLRIVNDLPGSVTGPNDWGKLNTVLWLRIAATEGVTQGPPPNQHEVLHDGNYTSSVSLDREIRPGRSREYDVSGLGRNYATFVQTGWWDYFCPSTCMWEKHASRVACCAGSQSCFKYASVLTRDHRWGTHEIRLSDYLPPGNWLGSSFCG